MAFKVAFRKKINPAVTIGLLISFVLVMFVGDKIIKNVDTVITTDLNGAALSTRPFGSAFGFLGITTGNYGMIGIIGFILAASLLLSIVKVSFR